MVPTDGLFVQFAGGLLRLIYRAAGSIRWCVLLWRLAALLALTFEGCCSRPGCSRPIGLWGLGLWGLGRRRKILEMAARGVLPRAVRQVDWSDCLERSSGGSFDESPRRVCRPAIVDAVWHGWVRADGQPNPRCSRKVRERPDDVKSSPRPGRASVVVRCPWQNDELNLLGEGLLLLQNRGRGFGNIVLLQRRGHSRAYSTPSR